MKYIKHLSLILFMNMIVAIAAVAADDISVKLQGKGFTQVGRIEKTTDTLGINFHKNWMESASARLTALVNINENWDGALGVGLAQVHKMQGRPAESKKLQVDIQSFIAQANFMYTLGEKENPKFQYTMGYMPFNYHTDVKNLGLYLLRGSVYPGFLQSGFEAKETQDDVANLLGINAFNNFGNYSHNVLLFSEVELRPYLDYSLAYIGQYQLMESAFKIGAGVNFYHYIPINSKITTPDPSIFSESIDSASVKHPYDRQYIYVDPLTNDTTNLTNKGIKLTTFYSLALNKILQIEGMSKEDLKLYGEIALIGVENYPGIYEKRSERIPIMFGFNIPTFNFLDHLSLEIEWYGAKYKNDMEELIEDGSPIPRSNSQLPGRSGTTYNPAGDSISFDGGNTFHPKEGLDYNNMVDDDVKWALHTSKTIAGHLKISGQIANDHFRPTGTGSSTSHMTAFSAPGDWYWMLKIAYFF